MGLAQEVKLELATKDDLSRIIDFLSTPEIDHSFVSPLSKRGISIEGRVRKKFEDGFWLIALHNGEVVGCRGCSGLVSTEPRIVEFSTIAISSAFRGRGVGTLLLRRAVEIALERYAPERMRFDGWSTNTALEKAALKAGFQKSRVFDDPTKRPPGVQSVEYVLYNPSQ